MDEYSYLAVTATSKTSSFWQLKRPAENETICDVRLQALTASSKLYFRDIAENLLKKVFYQVNLSATHNLKNSAKECQ